MAYAALYVGRWENFVDGFSETKSEPGAMALAFYAGMFSYGGWYAKPSLHNRYIESCITHEKRNQTEEREYTGLRRKLLSKHRHYHRPVFADTLALDYNYDNECPTLVLLKNKQTTT